MAVLFLLLLLLHFPRLSLAADDGDSSVTSMAPDELAALFQVMSSLYIDPTWPQFHPKPCTDTPWPGLQCEPLPSTSAVPLLRVTKLHIAPDVAPSAPGPPCRPRARLPAAALLRLPYLRSLSLFSCLADPVALPAGLFSNASALEQLTLISNPGLSGVIPASISRLRRLRTLSLSQNSFSGIIPPELSSLTQLEQLDLSYNHLAGVIPPELGNLSALTIVDLSWNQLAGAVPAAIGGLRRLQKLDLSHNNLTSRLPPELGRAQSIVLLDLGHNSLVGPIPDELAGLRNLQYLLLDDNPIKTALPQFVPKLGELVVLGLSGCGLTGPLPAGYFRSLTKLTALSLDRNALDGPVPAGLEALPHLGQVNLSQNRLAGDVGVALPGEFVRRLGRRLDIRDNGGLCIDEGKFETLSAYLAGTPVCGGGGEGSKDAASVRGSSSASLLPAASWVATTLGLVYVVCMI